MYEWVDVAIYDDAYAIQVGVSGVGLVSREDGRVLDEQNNGRGYSVDSDGDLIVVGTRTDRVGLWRFQEEKRSPLRGLSKVPEYMRRSLWMMNWWCRMAKSRG